MNCSRCHGLMVAERVVTRGRLVFMDRCINCGNRIDGTVISNRWSLSTSCRKEKKMFVGSRVSLR